MKFRRAEKEINYYSVLRGTISLVNGGDSYAMNMFRHLSAEEQMKVMNDIECMLSAPVRSEIWELAVKNIGLDFAERLSVIYNYCCTITRLQSARA